MLRKTFLAAILCVVLSATEASAHVILGSTWYSDGTRTKTVHAGDTIKAYATGAIQNVPYRLVICSAGVAHPAHACEGGINQIVNPTIVYAGPSGIIGGVTGSVTYNVPGTYQLVFFDSSVNEATGTGGATITIVS